MVRCNPFRYLPTVELDQGFIGQDAAYASPRLEPKERRPHHGFSRGLTPHRLIDLRPVRTTRSFCRTEIRCLPRSALAPIDASEISPGDHVVTPNFDLPR